MFTISATHQDQRHVRCHSVWHSDTASPTAQSDPVYAQLDGGSCTAEMAFSLLHQHKQDAEDTAALQAQARNATQQASCNTCLS